MSDFFGKLKSGAGKVAFEADKMARLSRAQGEVSQVKKQIEADYIKLGEMYYDQVFKQGAPAGDPAFTEICQHIAAMEQQLASKNEEVQRINAETYSAQGAAQPAQPAPAPVVTPPPPPVETFTEPETIPNQVAAEAPASATRFCPNCGKEQPANVKFCTDCGTKLM